MKKLLVNFINRLERLPGKDNRPNFSCFSVTEDCILKCKMCYKWRRDSSIKADNPPPGVDEWKQALRSLRRITEEGFVINFGGGEPLLMKDIFELVSFANDLGFKTNIATNAYLIDADMARRIADSGLSTINISLDSMKEDTHDYLRGVEGVYKRVMKAIEYLHTYSPELKKGICSVIHAVNLDDIIELAEAVQKDSRLEWIYFMAAMQPNNTRPQKAWYKEDFSFLWPQDTRKVHAVINRLIELKSRGYKIVNLSSQLKAFKSYFANPERFVKTAECNLSRALHVSSVGDVFICFQWDRLGNIKSDSIEELWRSREAEDVRKKISGCKNNCHFLINCFFEGDFPFEF